MKKSSLVLAFALCAALLSLILPPPVAATQDDMGIGDDASNTIEYPTALSIPISGTGYLDASDTVDYYRVATYTYNDDNAGMKFKVSPAGSFGIDVYYPGSDNFFCSSTDSTTVLGGGYYWVGVSSVGSGGTYTLEIFKAENARNDMGLGGDTGDSFDSAMIITAGSGTGTIGENSYMVQDTADYYKILVSTGQTITVSLTPPSGASLNLELYDSNQSRVTIGQSGSLNYTATSPGYYYIVISRGSGSGTYSLTVAVGGATTTTDMGTGGDAGSTNDTAATISQGSGTGYMGGTVDVYKIAVSSGQTLSVTMTPPSDANYDLTIRDSSVALDQSTNGVGQTESADTTAVSSGYLYIWVSKASVEEGDNHNYALTVTVTESSGATTTTTPAAVSVTNISSSVGQTISVAENGVTSITVTSATAMTVNFETAQPVKSISVTTSGAASSVSVQAEQLSAKPSAVTDPTTVDSGIIVSHYLDLSVTPTAATSVSVESATVEFKVTKSWLTANNIDPATVKLMRYSGGWTELSTSATTEDATYKYYSATTPGFSTFAVTGKAAAAAPSDSTMLIIAGAVILIVVIAAAVFVTKFRKP